MDDKNIKEEDFLINMAYLMAMALDLILRESERRMKQANPNNGWKFKKKMLFNQFIDCIKKAYYLSDQIFQDVLDCEFKNETAYVDVWQEESNELARLCLLYGDRSTDAVAIDKILHFIEQMPSDGYCSDEMLSRFYLKKLNTSNEETK